MAANRKTFQIFDEKTGKPIDLAIVKPNQDVVNEAELIYSSHYAKAISRGVPTLGQARTLIYDKKLWTKEDDEKIDEINKEIKIKEKKLAGKDKLSEKDAIKICEEMAELRSKKDERSEKYSTLIGHSAEYLAEGVKMQYYVAMCTVYADDNKPFFADKEGSASYQIYIEKSNSMMILIIHTEAYRFFNNIEDKKKVENIEIEYLIDKKKINSAGKYINEEGKLVDKEGRRINEFGEYIVVIDEIEHIADKFGNPINEDGSINIELDKKIHPKDYK
jgi:hypothetical protein